MKVNTILIFDLGEFLWYFKANVGKLPETAIAHVVAKFTLPPGRASSAAITSGGLMVTNTER